MSPLIRAVLLMLLSTAAFAHDSKRPDLDKWFGDLASKKGKCCSTVDGALVQDADWDTVNGHYRVRIDKQWVDVPDDAVIEEPNRYGPAVVWGYRASGYSGNPNSYVIRCFMAGVMG